jgi:hypothetical protein
VGAVALGRLIKRASNGLAGAVSSITRPVNCAAANDKTSRDLQTSSIPEPHPSQQHIVQAR